MDTIGALVLRGNRCVLVRSLSKPPAWEGMQLPKVVPHAGETAMAAAMRAADECCNIDASSELEPLPNIPPVVAYMGGARRVWIHVLYAKYPAPPSQTDEQEDEDDLYDWYTWPRAAAALSADPSSVQALRAMAFNLAGAAAAHPPALPNKWGGIFGSDFAGALPADKAHDAGSQALPIARSYWQSMVPRSTFSEQLPARQAILSKWYPRVPKPRAAEKESPLTKPTLSALSTSQLIDGLTAVSAALDTRYGRGGPGGGTPAAEPPAAEQPTGGSQAPGRHETSPRLKFRAHRPFHPLRLSAALEAAQKALDLRARASGPPRRKPSAKGAEEEEEEEEEDEEDESDGRLRGLAWLATQPGLQADVGVNDDDGSVYVDAGQAWWACIPRSKWPEGLEAEILPLWREPHGDRQTELTLPTPSGPTEAAAVKALEEALEASLVTDAEWEAATELDDPWAEEWQATLRATEKAELADRLLSEVKQAFGTKKPLFGGRSLVCEPCVSLR